MPVRSGDHDAFTRLVIPLSDGRNWSVRQTGETANLTIAGQTDGYDTQTVFDRIQPTRIKSISSSGSTLQIGLDCDCDIAPFLTDEGLLVIDVADQGRSVFPPITRSETTTPDRSANVQPVPTPLTIASPKAGSADPFLRNLKPDEVLITDSDPLSMPLRSALEQQVLNDVQLRLAQEIGAATTRGMLTPTTGGILTPPNVRGRVDRPDLASSTMGVTSTPTDLPLQQNHMRVTSSMDLPFSADDINGATVAGAHACPRPEDLDVSTWFENPDFTTQIGAGRRALFGEFDRLDQRAALDLARAYLYFGFGAEASAVLALDDTLPKSHHDLRELSQILEHGHVRGESQLSRYTNCDSDVAFWAMLAEPNLQTSGTINTDAALRAVNKLPVHLRTFLAPELSNRLLASGRKAAATAALRSIRRLPNPLQPEGALASARIELAGGDADTAHQELSAVIDANAPPSPEALIELVNSKLERDEPIPIETAALVEAYATELRNTPIGLELRQTHVMALAKSGQFDQAIQHLQALGDRSSDLAIAGLQVALLTELVHSASDIVFLEYFYGQPANEIARLEPKTILHAAMRLQENGFSGVAMGVLAALPDRPMSVPRQLLAAKIALAMDHPERAIAELINVDDLQANRLRAKAQQMTGAHQQAHQSFLASGETQDAVNAAWMAEEWNQLMASDTPVFGAVAQLSNTATPNIAPSEGMLRQTTEALAESADARAEIETLLSAPSLQTAVSTN